MVIGWANDDDLPLPLYQLPSILQERNLVPKASFESFCYWNLDSKPTDNDAICKAFQWIEIANVVCHSSSASSIQWRIFLFIWITQKTLYYFIWGNKWQRGNFILTDFESESLLYCYHKHFLQVANLVLSPMKFISTIHFTSL